MLSRERANPATYTGAIAHPGRRVRTLRRRRHALGSRVRAARLAGRPCSTTARASHQAWLERIFSDRLPKTPGARRRAIHALHAATDVYTWKLLRRDLRLSRDSDRTHHAGSRQWRPGDEFARRRAATTEQAAMRTAAISSRSFDGGGNVPSELSAARRLVERGHAVTVLAEDSVAWTEFRAAGALSPLGSRAEPARSKTGARSRRDWECKYPWQLVDRLLEDDHHRSGGVYAHDVSQAIAQTSPDVVICSMFCVGGMIAAEERACRSHAVLHVYRCPRRHFRPSAPDLGRHERSWVDGVTVR